MKRALLVLALVAAAWQLGATSASAHGGYWRGGYGHYYPHHHYYGGYAPHYSYGPVYSYRPHYGHYHGGYYGGHYGHYHGGFSVYGPRIGFSIGW